MRNYRIKCLAISTLSLLAGLVIYIFLRDDTYIHDFLSVVLNLTVESKCINSVLCDFLKYYFVDYLWGAALAFSLCSVAVNLTHKSIVKMSCVSFALGVLFEIAQYFSLVNGTFDFIDICMYAAASIVCAAININLFLRRKL